MKRFFIEHSEIIKDFPVIAGQEAQHITKVFRLKPRDSILLIDGTGIEYDAEIIGVSKAGVSVTILDQHATNTESPVQIAVGQGYLKDKKMDMLVRHLMEIGITQWIPVLSEHSVPQAGHKKNGPPHPAMGSDRHRGVQTVPPDPDAGDSGANKVFPGDGRNHRL